MKQSIKYMVMILCCTYNHEKYLRDALNGFISQRTDFPFIAVIIDDFSSDGTAKILHEYEEKYPEIIKAVYLKENYFSQHKSKYPLYNSISMSSKYVALCEGDDYWTDPFKLQKQVGFMEAHSECSMCFHNAKVQNEANVSTYFSEGIVEDRDYCSNEIFPKWIIPTASILYRREVVDKIQIKHRDWLMYEDIGLFLSCAKVGTVHGFSDSMSVYRINSGGITQKRDDQLYRHWIRHERCLRMNFPELDKKRLNRSISSYYYSLFKNGNNLFYKCTDLLLAFLNSPQYVFNKMMNAIHRFINHNNQ